MADGFSLNIDPKFMQDLEKAEQKIKDIATASEKTRDIVIDSFTKMRTQGLDPFVQAAKTFQQEMRGMRVVNIGLGVVSREAATATDKINLLVDALNKLLVANGKVNASNSKDSNVSKVNQLYKERLQIEERLHKMMLTGAKGGTVTPYESNNISRLAQRAQVIESEIDALKNSSKVSSQVILAIMKNEEQYTQAIQKFASERQAARNAEVEQQKKEAEAEKIRLAQLAKQRAEMYKKQNYAQNTTTQGALKFSDTAKTYNREKQAIEYLTIARNNLSKSDKDYANTLELLNKAIRKHEENLKNATRTQEELTAAQNKRNKASRNTTNQADKQYAQNIRDYNNAMKASEATINQRTNKLARLRQVEAQMAQDEARYAQQLSRVRAEMDRLSQANDKASKKTKELQKNQRNLMDTAGQFQRKLALLFSVSAIQGYVSKLVEVRGEFELQQKSLEVLLQNKDEADKLWRQTIDLAVKSPFRVKQLVTYTRQLAAYRIETEKLHDTTRRLSDVSAGLGVDMQRIILAFGQVRAANFLRGTELRQFTEAGIPMLDELAKYFTELEGRAISAGDVFEMISKRMVSFSDVEEVFHRMTNAGGVFYKMQEEQSKTLSGLISNLHDSIDLMLNDIGKSNDGVLKGSINTMRQFVDNWREVAYTLEKVVIAYSLYKIANAAFILGSKNAATTTLWWNNALKAKIGTTMADIQTMTLQEASLYGVSKGQYAAGKATMFFQGAIRGVGLALKMAAPFLLAFMAIEIVRYFTAASRAAAELQRELEEIYQSDYTNFKKQSDTLKDLVERLKNVTKGSQEHKDIISRLNSSYGEYLGNLNEETATYENLAASIDKTVMALSQKAKAQTLEKAIAKSFEKTNKEIMSLQEDITKGMERLVRESGGAMLVPQEQEINDFFNLFEKRTKEAGELLDRSDINKILSEYYGENVMITSDIDFSHFVSLGEQILEQKQQEEKVQRQINNLYGEGIYSTQKAREEFQKLEEDKAKALQNEKTRIGRQKIETQFEMARIDLQVKYEGLDKNIADYRKSLAKGISATVEDINRQIIESIPELGDDVADKIFIDQATAATGLESIAESTAQAYKGQLELIKQQNALKNAGTVYDQKLLTNAERMAKGYYKRLEIMGRLDLLKKSSNDSDSKELQLLNRQLSAIKDASSAFENLSDIYGGEEAKQKVASSFANLFKELNISEITDDMDFDALGVVRVLNQLPNIAGERGAQAIEKLKAEFNSEIDVDLRIGRVKTIEEQISELFSGYELSVELDKMNIPEDLAQSVFNIDATSLPALKEQVKSFEDELIALGDKGVEIWNKSQKKIEEVEKKNQLERLKKYTQYLIKAQSERVKIKMDEIRQLKEIEDTFELKENVAKSKTLGMTDTQWDAYSKIAKANEEINEAKLKSIGLTDEQIKKVLEYNKQMETSKQLAQEGVKKETQQKVDKAVWDEFKGSAMYEQLFGDLENLGTKSINVLMDKLKDMREALKQLPPEVYKEIQTRLDKLSELKMERNPLSEFKKAFKEIEDLRKKRVSYTDDDGKEITLKGEDAIVYELQLEEEKAEKIREQIQLYQQIYAANGDINTLKEVGISLTDEQTKLLGDNKAINREILKLQDDLGKAEEAARKKGEDVQKFKTARESLTKVKDATTKWGEAISGVLGGVDEILDAFGVAEDDTARLWVNNAMQIADMTVQVVILTASLKAMGVAANTALGVVGWIAMALQGVAMIFANLFTMGDKKKERQIQREIELVEELEHKYKKLEKAIDNAYALNTLQRSGQQAKSNINQQIAAYERMIQAEKDKKKTDEGRIKEWKQAIDDLREQKAELDKEIVGTATGGVLDDVLSAAQDFTNAWLDAFNETGDGLDGLSRNFKETMLEMVKQQAAMLISQAYIDKWKHQLSQYINPNDLELTTDEARRWIDSVTSSLPQLNEALERYFLAMKEAGVDLTGGNSELSGLQRGIQGITEQQADILAAYLNSIRFFVSDNNTYLSRIAESLGNTEIENPMVGQLRIIASQTTAINELLNSLTSGGHSMGGRGFRVFIS